MAAGVDVAEYCPACLEEFGFLRWRHLCRLCQVNFCDDCTPHRYRISRQDSDPQRVCGPCLVGIAAVNRDSPALSNLSIALLKQAGAARGIDLRTCFDKSSIVDTLITQIIMRLPAQPRPAEPPRPSASRSQPPPPQQQRSASSNSFQQPPPASTAAPRSQPPLSSQPASPSSSSSSTPNLQEKPIPQSYSSSQANYDNLDAPEIDTTKMGAKQLREFLEKYGIDSRDCFDKESLVDLAKRVATDPSLYLISEDDTCIICMDARISTEFRECGHKSSCKACSKVLIQKTNSCPMCRQRITRVVDFYHTSK